MAEDAAPGLRIEREGHVTQLVIDRPERRNALDLDTLDALTEALRSAESDKSVRAVVLAGTDKDFCTGADIPRDAPPESPLDYRRGPEPYLQFTRLLWELELPMVSAVTGTVAGMGWVIALCGDLVVARDDARWTHVFSKLGMVPHAGDPALLPHLIPLQRLNEIAMLSEAVTSRQLHEWGVVARSVPEREVRSTALELARRLAAGPTLSLGLTKQLYRRALVPDLSRSFDNERAAVALVSTTEDRHEGSRAFAERREPKFGGR